MADLIDRDALLKDMGLTDAVKYGNKDSEQQTRSYSTWMSYEIADAIQDAPSVNRWIPCSERLPYIGVDVIVYVRTWREHKVQFGYRYSENTWSVANIGVPNDEITHWMPLPEPPKRGAENGTT